MKYVIIKLAQNGKTSVRNLGIAVLNSQAKLLLIVVVGLGNWRSRGKILLVNSCGLKQLLFLIQQAMQVKKCLYLTAACKLLGLFTWALWEELTQKSLRLHEGQSNAIGEIPLLTRPDFRLVGLEISISM